MELTYALLVRPIEALLAWLLVGAHALTGSYGVALAVLSVGFNLMLLPFYRIAERVQGEERAVQARMAPKLAEFKSAFTGNERFLYVRELYRVHAYHPIMSLRSAIPLLVQIPVFIAAWMLLRDFPPIVGQSFLFIADLSEPDGLLHGVNILPFVMTACNLVAAGVYTANRSTLERAQTWIVAALFLLLLYGAPAALVLYWTFNNLFSIAKNLLFAKYGYGSDLRVERDGERSAVSAAMASIAWRATAALLLATLGSLPLALAARDNPIAGVAGYSAYHILNVLAVVVPVTIIVAIAVRRSGVRASTVAAAVSTALIVVALICAYVLPWSHGVLDNYILSRPESLAFSPTTLARDAVIVLGGFAVAVWLVLRRGDLLRSALSVLLVGLVLHIAFGARTVANAAGAVSTERTADNSAVYRYGREGQNIVVFMVDGAMSGFLELILEEDAELREAYQGFTWFENVVSTGDRTINGLPAVLGGFDYDVSSINAINGESLEKKVSAAYAVLPDNFGPAGFDVLYSDPFWYGFVRRGDCRLFESRTTGRCVNRIDSVGGSRVSDQNAADEKSLRRGLLYQYLAYGLLRATPPSLRGLVYDDGSWLGASFVWKRRRDKYLVNMYALEALPESSTVVESADTLTVIVNNITRATVLQNASCRPDETRALSPAELVRLGDVGTIEIVDTQTCALRSIGNYLDWFRAQGVYDNSMIVLVSDHGWVSNNLALKNDPHQRLHSKWQPLLMVKPFGARRPIERSTEFVSNASVPAIVCDVIGGCTDRRTGKAVRREVHERPVQLHSTPWNPQGQYPDRYRVDQRLEVHTNISIPGNWSNGATEIGALR